MEKEKQIRFCPVCASTSLKWLRGGNLGDQYECPNCGYVGIALQGSEQFIKSYREKLSEEHAGKK